MESKGQHFKKIGRSKFNTNCSAKGKIVVYNDDVTQAFIYAKGKHDSSFVPSFDPRRITPEKRLQVVEAYHNFKPSVKRIARTIELERKQVSSIIQYEKKSKQMAADPFLSFKLRLAKLHKNNDIVVLVPKGMTLLGIKETDYVVLILNQKLLDIGLKGKGRIVQGIDTVYKITSFHAPINFKGVIQAITIAHDNTHKTLMQILDTFIQHIRAKHPDFNRQCMIDAAKANLSVMYNFHFPCVDFISQKDGENIYQNFRQNTRKKLANIWCIWVFQRTLRRTQKTMLNFKSIAKSKIRQRNAFYNTLTRSIMIVTRHGLQKQEFWI